MGTQKRSGFTIIEVMLFLAITGALTVAILVGSGAAIGRQRYTDSVNSLKGLIQEQYSQIANVINSEVRNPMCSPSGVTLSFNSESGQPRGTSQCLVIGRFLLVEPTKVTAYNVIGQPPVNVVGNDDSTVLRSYAVAVQSPEAHEVSWGAKIVKPKDGRDIATTGILIVRSPLSGSILTYTRELPSVDVGSDTSLNTAVAGIIAANTGGVNGTMEEKEFCVDPSGGLPVSARRRAVRISARAASQSAIEIPLESENVCD